MQVKVNDLSVILSLLIIDSPLKSIQVFQVLLILQRSYAGMKDGAFYSDREYKQGTSATNLYRLKLEWLTGVLNKQVTGVKKV